jgi:hypothetical protein
MRDRSAMGWLNPFPAIWRADPAHIPIPGDSKAALARLRARTPRFAISPFMAEGCVGRVEPDRIKVSYYRSGSRNLSLVLDARVAHDGLDAYLTGHYRESVAARLFLTAWFGLAILFILGGCAEALSDRTMSSTDALLVVAFPSGLFLFGCALNWWNQRGRDNNRQLIESFLSRCLAERTA